MMVWTLYILLVLDTGDLSVLQGRSFTTERSCEIAAAVVWESEMAGVSKAIPVCKQTTNV